VNPARTLRRLRSSPLGQASKDTLKGSDGKDLCGGKSKDTASQCEVESRSELAALEAAGLSE
jgi:hypothetical protein